MNARTIKRILMRGRANVMWGQRAYLTVSLPLSLFPTPPPPFERPGKVWLGDEGSYYNLLEGNRIELFLYGRVYGTLNREQEPGEPTPRLVTPDERNSDTGHWWTGSRIVAPIAKVVNGEYYPDHDNEEIREDAPEAGVLAYAAWRGWFNRYTEGYFSDKEVEEAPLLAEFHYAGNWAKTQYGSIVGDRIHITYSVKWRYPKRKLNFCAALARAVEGAKAAGHDVRVLRKSL